MDKSKNPTINPKNKDDECFAYATIAALNHHKIDNYPERISKLYLMLMIIIGVV